MSAERDDAGTALPGDNTETLPGRMHAGATEVMLSVNDAGVYTGSRQQAEDAGVAAELRRLVLSRLPDDGSLCVVLCEDPEVAGITHEALAAAMIAAYGKAGIGERAEGMSHFDRLFRGYDNHQHGPPRLAIIEGADKQVWVFCDYFRVFDGYGQLGPLYAPAAAQWQERAGLWPAEYVMSKLVNTKYLIGDPRIRRIAAGLGARVFASIVQGLANADPRGMLLAGNAQLGTRNFVMRHLSSLLTGELEIILDMMHEGENGEVPQAQMMIHVSPAADKE